MLKVFVRQMPNVLSLDIANGVRVGEAMQVGEEILKLLSQPTTWPNLQHLRFESDEEENDDFVEALFKSTKRFLSLSIDVKRPRYVIRLPSRICLQLYASVVQISVHIDRTINQPTSSVR